MELLSIENIKSTVGKNNDDNEIKEKVELSVVKKIELNNKNYIIISPISSISSPSLDSTPTSS
jgi:hypothetical protein